MHARPRTYITSAARPATTLPTCTALAAARRFARLPALAYPSASKNVTFALAVTLLADDAWPKPSPLIVMSVTRQEYLQSMSFSSTVCAAAYASVVNEMLTLRRTSVPANSAFEKSML